MSCFVTFLVGVTAKLLVKIVLEEVKLKNLRSLWGHSRSYCSDSNINLCINYALSGMSVLIHKQY